VVETRRGVGTFIAARTLNREEDASRRRTDLRRLVDRFLADLSSHGFRLEEAVAALEDRRQQGA
jgi:DNA-binding transcriptional regulator YhcF (GntR family)